MAVKTPTPGRLKKFDEELKQFLETKKHKIKVIGCGGAGNNAITRMTELGIEGAKTVAVNTDALDLLHADADEKVLIGKALTGGLGAGGDPRVGEESARESVIDLKKMLQGCDMVFVTCGLGGGTGTGSAPVVGTMTKQMKILTVGVVTLPFRVEGQWRTRNALEGLARMRRAVDTLVVIPNDKMLEVVPNIPIDDAFKRVDNILVNSVKGVIELVTKAGMVNLDFADVKSVMGGAGLAMIGMAESNRDQRAIDSVTKALNDPFLPVDITGATGALINIVGNPKMSLAEANAIVDTVSSKLSDDAQIVWGAQIEDGMKDRIRTMVIITGVKETVAFEHIVSGADEMEREELKEVLGIEFFRE